MPAIPIREMYSRLAEMTREKKRLADANRALRDRNQELNDENRTLLRELAAERTHRIQRTA